MRRKTGEHPHTPKVSGQPAFFPSVQTPFIVVY